MTTTFLVLVYRFVDDPGRNDEFCYLLSQTSTAPLDFTAFSPCSIREAIMEDVRSVKIKDEDVKPGWSPEVPTREWPIYGYLKDDDGGTPYYVQRAKLYSDGFHFFAFRPHSGTGLYLVPFNVTNSARNSAGISCILTVAPPGVKAGTLIEIAATYF